MRMMQAMKIKTKLKIPIYFQVMLIIVIALLLLYFNNMNRRSETGKGILDKVTAETRQMSYSIDDFLKRKLSLDEISSFHKKISELLVANKSIFSDETKLEDFNGLVSLFKDIDGIYQQNNSIEKKVFDLTEISLTQSNDYIRLMSQRLADKNLQNTVSTLQRLVINGANINTNANYNVRVLFLKAKENIENSPRLFSFLDDAIANSKNDEKRLLNTPFVELPRKSIAADTEIKQISTTFVENSKKIDTLKSDLLNRFNNVFSYVKDLEAQMLNSSINAAKNIFLNLLLIVGVIGLIIIIIGFRVARQIIDPLNKLNKHAHELATENVDMSKRIEIHSNDEIGELSGWFNKFLDRLEQLILKVKKSSDELSRSTEDIASGSEDLAVRASEQAASITETSTTVEQFASSIRENTENSVEADMMLSQFNSEIREKSTLIENVTFTMTEIYDSSKEIDNIIKVINDISFQTNLLALNAAVEAARAGEAGRGFAVVAAEVRNLAQKTAESSKSIQEIVLRNVESTQKGMELVKDTSVFFNEVVGVMNDIVQKIANITNISRGQASSSEQINHAISQMENVSNENARLVDQLSNAGKNVKINTVELLQLMSEFQAKATPTAKTSTSKVQVEKTVKPSPSKEKPAAPTPPKKKETHPTPVKETKPVQSKPAPKPEKPAPKPEPSVSKEDDFFGNTDEDGFEEF